VVSAPTPACFGGCSLPCSQPEALSAVDSEQKRPRRGGGAADRTPTEGGWFLAGCSARSTPPSADESKPLSHESFPEP
jgi:hypothetical protein